MLPKAIKARTTVFALCTLTAHLPLQAAIDLGRGILISDLGFKSEYTSNSQSSASGQEDWINTLTPALRYESYGTEWSTNASLGISFLSYSKEDERNSENLNFSASASHPRGISFNGGVNETTSGNSEFGQITRTRRYSFSTSITYKLSPRYPISTGFSYTRSLPVDDSSDLNRNDTESFSIPLIVNYQYSETLRIGGGYSFRQENSDATREASDSTNHSIFANALGAVLPRVDANISLGIQMRNDDEGNRFSPFASGGLSWKASSLTSLGVDLLAGFQTTTGNRTSREFSITSNLRHQFPRNVSGTLFAGLSQTEFSDIGSTGDFTRTDTSWNIGTALNTKIYEHTSIGLSLRYRRNNSDESRSQFDSYSIAFTASQPF